MAEMTKKHIFLVGEYPQSSAAKALDACRIMSAVFPEFAVVAADRLGLWYVRLWSDFEPADGHSDHMLTSHVAMALKLALG